MAGLKTVSGHKPKHRLPCREAVDLISRFETLVLRIYDDGYGYPTIGWGHYIDTPEELAYFQKKGTISRAEADALLVKDLETACRAVERLIRVPLNDFQFGALVSFTFNAGSGNLQQSTLRQKLNRGEYDAVPAQLMRFVYAGRPPRKSRGLKVRRQAEADLWNYRVQLPWLTAKQS